MGTSIRTFGSRNCIAQSKQYEYQSVHYSQKNKVSHVRRLKLLREQVWNSAVGILVGNKADLKDKRAVTFAEGIKFAREHELRFIEASAADDQHIANVSCRDPRSRLSDGLASCPLRIYLFTRNVLLRNSIRNQYYMSF